MKRAPLIPLFALAFFPWPEFLKSQADTLKDGEFIEGWFSSSCDATAASRDIIHLEVAKSEPFQRKGLSNRKDPMKQDKGMLFIFSPRRIGRIWMKDTLIPLQLVHIDPDGQVMELQNMDVEKNPAYPTRIYQAYPEVDAVLELKPSRLPADSKGKLFCVRKKEKKK